MINRRQNRPAPVIAGHQISHVREESCIVSFRNYKNDCVQRSLKLSTSVPFFFCSIIFSRFFHRKYHRKNNDPCDYGAFWCSPEQLFCLTEKVGSWEGSKSKQFRNWRFKQLNWNNQSVSNHLYIRQNVFWNPVNYPVPTDRTTKIVHNAKSILPDGGSGVPGYLGV